MKTPLASQLAQQGNVLVIAISLVAMTATLVGTGIVLNANMMRNADRSQQYLRAQALAAGALEALYGQWRPMAPNTPLNSGNPPAIAGITAPSVSGITSGMVQLVKPTLSVSSNGTLQHLPMAAGTQPDRALLATNSSVPNYKATATVQFPSSRGTVRMTASQIFRYSGRAPTDWAIIEFVPERLDQGTRRIGGALEIHPGPRMNVEKVHTNGILYTAHTSLYLEDATTFGGDWFIAYHPLNTGRGAPSSGPVYPNNLPPVKGDRQTFFNINPHELELGVNPSDRDQFDSNPSNDNLNNDSYREMLEAPYTAHSDPLNKPGQISQRPYDQASIKIQIEADNTLRVFKRNSTEVFPGDPLYNTIFKAINPLKDVNSIVTNPSNPSYRKLTSSDFQTIRDNRTGGNVRLTSLDVLTLTKALQGGEVNSSTGAVVIPNLSKYSFGYPLDDYGNPINPADDNTRPVVDPNPSNPTLPDGWNGAIHFEDKSANYSTGNHRGLRLRRGGQLPKIKRTGVGGDGTLVGLTIITPNPAYIEGDFNTGTTYNNGVYDSMPDDRPVTQPSSNRSPNSNNSLFDGANRIVSGYQDTNAVYTDAAGVNHPIIPPAAIMADAVNILSNAWYDSNSTNGLNSRVAAHTTVNAAIIAGVVPTGARDAEGQIAGYSGGAENYPRFLESWTNKTFTYHGSMIMAFESEQAFVRWGKSNVYNAPDRRWFHEDSFKTFTLNGVPVNNPPPLLPQRIYSFPRSPIIIENFAIN